MNKPAKAAPQTAKQRQGSFRQAKTAEGFIEVRMWLRKQTLEKIKELASTGEITQGEVVDQLLTK